MASSKRKMNRRTALAEAARMTGAVCLGGFSLAALIQSTAKADARAMRPPGAQPEADFLSACVRCGLCVQACPYGTLSLAEWGQEPPVGTPFFTPREVPCYMCRDVPCARACPTGALDSTIAIRDAEMGASERISIAAGQDEAGNRIEIDFLPEVAYTEVMDGEMALAAQMYRWDEALSSRDPITLPDREIVGRYFSRLTLTRD